MTSDKTTELESSKKNYCSGTKKNRHIDQQNRRESLETEACIYGQLIYDKGGKNVQWRKGSLFKKSHTGTATWKGMRLECSFTLYTNTNSRWIEDLNGRLENITILEENIGRALLGINCINFVLGSSPKAMETKTKTKQMRAN